jgi:hypothetical protein
MITNLHSAAGATQTHARTRELFPPVATRKTAKTIALLLSAEHTSDLASVFGPTLRGAICGLFDENGRTPLHPSLRLIIGDTGPTGFMLGSSLRHDYAKPQNGPSLYAGSNMNLAVGLASPPHEEQLVHGLAQLDLPEEMLVALCERGLDIVRLPRRVAHRIQLAIVSDCIAHAIPSALMGELNLLRSFPPTIRAGLIEGLLACEKSGAVRDQLLQAPILSLAPTKLIANVGRKPKEILKELGLPVEARKLRPRALSPLRRWMLHDGRDISIGDMPWLTPALLTEMPQNAIHQYRLVSLAFYLLLKGLDDAEVAARTLWAARHAAELFAEKAPIADWLSADAEFLQRAAIKAWSPMISAASALEAANVAVRAHELLNSAASGDQFPLPQWAVERRLPRARWALHPLATPFELEACGRRNRHCVGGYASACRNRGVVIAEIRRPVTLGSSLPSVDGQEIGATVEIAERWGRWHLIQAKGASNGEPVASAVAAIHRLLGELNGEVV